MLLALDEHCSNGKRFLNIDDETLNRNGFVISSNIIE